jgi:hypothetical protein
MQSGERRLEAGGVEGGGVGGNQNAGFRLGSEPGRVIRPGPGDLFGWGQMADLTVVQ